jgi:hypothetical protein
LESTALNLSSESAAQLARLRQDILEDAKQLLKDNVRTEPTPATAEVKDGMWKIRLSLDALSSKMNAVPRESIILQNIFFSSMNLREEAIDEPESGTFKWVFDAEEQEKQEEEEGSEEHMGSESPRNEPDGLSTNFSTAVAGEEDPDQRGINSERPPPTSRTPSQNSWKGSSSGGGLRERPARKREYPLRIGELERRSKTRTLFLTWLRSGAGVFHISGKAGSGKSTLMKFLCHHNRTQEELAKWAAEKQKTLVFASFYFWNSGDDLQMSLAGLHRSILFETLKRYPDLIRVVFPRAWDQLADPNGAMYIPGNLFSGPDITTAFEMLTAHATFPDHCFCFFIDGLDEYRGESWDHVQLTKSLQRWSAKGDVKICASSRPYLEFDKLTSSADQKFHLHEMTQHDIYLFSRQMIENDDNFDQVEDSYLRLVDKIVDMAEGVFLWARLVVSSLLAGMLRHDTTATLEEKLEVIPKDIDKLYDNMLGSLEPFDQQRAAKLLLMTVHYPFDYLPLNCRAYGWVDRLSDPSFPPCDGRKCPSWRPANAMVEDVQRQLKSLTKGLLETTPFPHLRRSHKEPGRELSRIQVVQFFHRTVKDFVMKSPRLDDISRRCPSLLDEASYYRLLLADLTLGSLTYRRDYWNEFMWGQIEADLFHHTLTPTLLGGFRLVLDIGKGEPDAFFDWTDVGTDHGMFYGALISIGSSVGTKRMSFIHVTAFTGQVEYVLQEVSQQPELLKGNGEMHLLFSAAFGDHKNLVTALINRGSSPTDLIKPIGGGSTKTTGLHRIPVWLAVAGYMVGYFLEYSSFKTSFEILELLLDADGVDAWNCVFLLRKHYKDPVSHFISLEQFIRDVEPENKERLLSLIEKSKPGSYLGGVRRFVSQLTSFYKPVEVLTPLGTDEFTPFHTTAGMPKMKLAGIVYGGLRIDDYRLWLY